jgi:hypothetical protein
LQYRVTGDDGASVEVEAFDWMMAMVHAIELLGLQVSGWVCESHPDGSTKVLDPLSGRSWTVVVVGEGAVVESNIAGQSVSPTQASRDDLVARATPPPVAPRGGLSSGGTSAPVFKTPAASEAAPSQTAPSQAASDAAPALQVPEPGAGLRPEPGGGLRPRPTTLGEHVPKRPRPASAADLGPAGISISAGTSEEDGPPADLAERLFESSMDLTMAASPDEACQQALTLVMDLVPCEAGSVLRGGLNDDHLTFVAVAGPAAPKLRGQRLSFGQGIVGASFDLGIAIEVANVSQDPRHVASFDEQTGFQTRSVLCVPVQGMDQYHGAIQLLNPASGRFAQWHREVAEQVAASLASTLDGVTG